MIDRFLFGNDQNISRRTYIWNLCSSMIYSIQSAILLLIVTRAGGLVEAGVFTIIYTFTQMLASLGSYSMRNYQVSDIKKEYQFSQYYTSRLVTCVIMVLVCIIFAVYKHNGAEYFLVVLCFSFYRFTDGIEDVYHGEVQKSGRLDAASVAQTIRITLSIVAFSACYICTKNLLLSSCVLMILSLLLMCYFNNKLKKRFCDIVPKINFDGVIRLLFSCFPIFLGAIMYNYLVNAPKYSIDRNLGEEVQTVFNILFTPVFVINILSIFIFKPMVKKMGEWWNERKIRIFTVLVRKQTLIIIGLTAGVVICGYFLGCPVLSLVYGVKLKGYEIYFAELLMFGGVSALSTFYSVILTVMRKQYFIIFGYAIALCTNIIFTDKMVKDVGIKGAGYAYGLIMGSVLAFFAVCVISIVILNRRK